MIGINSKVKLIDESLATGLAKRFYRNLKERDELTLKQPYAGMREKICAEIRRGVSPKRYKRIHKKIVQQEKNMGTCFMMSESPEPDGTIVMFSLHAEANEQLSVHLRTIDLKKRHYEVAELNAIKFTDLHWLARLIQRENLTTKDSYQIISDVLTDAVTTLGITYDGDEVLNGNRNGEEVAIKVRTGGMLLGYACNHPDTGLGYFKVRTYINAAQVATHNHLHVLN